MSRESKVVSDTDILPDLRQMEAYFTHAFTSSCAQNIGEKKVMTSPYYEFTGIMYLLSKN